MKKTYAILGAIAAMLFTGAERPQEAIAKSNGMLRDYNVYHHKQRHFFSLMRKDSNQRQRRKMAANNPSMRGKLGLKTSF